MEKFIFSFAVIIGLIYYLYTTHANYVSTQELNALKIEEAKLSIELLKLQLKD